MLKKVTRKRYIIGCGIALLIAYLYQLSLGQDCAWDGCFKTIHPSFTWSIFGAPVYVLELEMVIGLIIWVAKIVQKEKAKS